MKQSPCEIIAHTLGALFTCSKVKNYVRIRTPFLYPDGDVIDLFYLEQDGVPTITDFGETLRWLKMQSLSLKRSPKQLKLIEDICLNHGIEFYKGMLSARIKEDNDLAKTIMRVSQGALRTADLWFTLRTRSLESTSEEIELFFTEKEVPFERNQTAAGRSGKIWRVDFHTRMPMRSSLVYVLSSGSRAASRGVVEHVVTAWYDLSNLKFGQEGLQFVSLFDDTMDIWIPEDFKLLQDLSTVARWTKPDEFLEILAA